MQIIEKPTILVTSTGRTGTEFFARFFADILPGSSSVHEPDIVHIVGRDTIPGYITQVRHAGVLKMVFLKLLGKWTLANLSDARLQGRLDDRQAARALRRQRAGLVARVPGSVYVESHFGYYGLLDVLPCVFANHRAIYIVRDGRNWVRSAYNWRLGYGKRGLQKLIGHRWPEARDVRGDPLARGWNELPLFDRLCWAWSRLNGFALTGASRNPHARVFHFEDIFMGENRYAHLDDLVSFATSIPGLDASGLRSTHGWLERKIHPSPDSFPAWEDWSDHQRQRFEQICGPLMEELGYKLQ